MEDCRTCKWNSYHGVSTDWVSCNHPVTLAKTPKWENGDPAMVDYRTGDVPVSQIHNLENCPVWAGREEAEAGIGTLIPMFAIKPEWLDFTPEIKKADAQSE